MVSEHSEPLKLCSIIHLATFPSPNLPTDSVEEANVFKNILSSAPYQEVLLTATGHDFYSVEREGDGTLA
jgi:hypothetical protein